MIDGVVCDRQRTVAAFVANFKAEIHDVLFADLQIVGDVLAVNDFAPAAFVQTEFGIDEIAMIFDEPVNAVERATAFFVGRERDDDVAIGLVTFAFVPDQVRCPRSSPHKSD